MYPNSMDPEAEKLIVDLVQSGKANMDKFNEKICIKKNIKRMQEMNREAEQLHDRQSW